MPERLKFPTAQLLSFTRKPESGVAKFSSTLPSDVMAQMEWTDIPECLTGANLEGELAASVVELIPKDAQLKRHAVELQTTKVNKFETVRLELEGKKGKGHRTELRFEVVFNDPKGARMLEEYMQTAGKCEVRISYERAAKQETLPGTEEADTKQQRLQ
jgi:hypothetical protein